MREAVNGSYVLFSRPAVSGAQSRSNALKSTVYDYFDLVATDATAHCSASTTRFMTSVVEQAQRKSFRVPPSSLAKA